MAIRRRKIQGMIDALLTENGITEGPVQVSQIAKAKGARIFADSLEGELSGFTYRDKSRAVIGPRRKSGSSPPCAPVPPRWICSPSTAHR